MRTTVTRSTFAEAMALLGIGPDVGTVHIAEGSIIATTFTPNRDDAGAFLSTPHDDTCPACILAASGWQSQPGPNDLARFKPPMISGEPTPPIG